MLCKNDKQTRELGAFLFYFCLFFNFLGVFLIKQLFLSRLLDMRLVIANSYPMRAHGIIVKYCSCNFEEGRCYLLWSE